MRGLEEEEEIEGVEEEIEGVEEEGKEEKGPVAAKYSNFLFPFSVCRQGWPGLALPGSLDHSEFISLSPAGSLPPPLPPPATTTPDN